MRRAAAEDRAGREVLDLALAVDRRVGDDRDRLLEVVGEVLALGRERGQRPVVAERADRLGAVGGHLLDQLHVVALPAEAGEDPVLDLDGVRGPGRGVAGDLGALERAAGLERAVVRRDLLGAGPLQPAPADLAQHLLVRVERRAPLVAVDRDHELLAGRQRLRLGDHLVDRDDAGLGAEDVVGAASRAATAAAARARRRRRRTRRRGGRSARPGPGRRGPLPGAGTCRRSGAPRAAPRSR